MELIFIFPLKYKNIQNYSHIFRYFEISGNVFSIPTYDKIKKLMSMSERNILDIKHLGYLPLETRKICSLHTWSVEGLTPKYLQLCFCWYFVSYKRKITNK